MRYEALAWSLLEVFAPLLGREARRRLASIAREWVVLAGWAYDLLIPYLALILGSISGRDAGLTHLPTFTWFPAGLACLAGLAVAWFLQARLPNRPRPYAPPLDAIRPEARLALYRAAMALWIPDMTIAIAVGGLLALAEWGLDVRIWRREPPDSSAISRLLRIVFSGLIFWGTRNLWLTAAMQAVIVWLTARNRPKGSSGEETASKEGGEYTPDSRMGLDEAREPS
jgi:hypothetical protein